MKFNNLSVSEKKIIPLLIGGIILLNGCSSNKKEIEKFPVWTPNVEATIVSNVESVAVPTNSLENLKNVEEVVEEIPLETQRPIQNKKKYVVCLGTNVNVRAEPSVDNGQILDKLNRDDVLECIGSTNDGWYEVIYKGQEAFVKSKYFSMFEKQIEDDNNMEIIRAKETVFVRTSNSANSEPLGVLGVGDVLEYVDITDNGWYKVKYKGYIGYVSSNYTELDTEGLHMEIVPVVTAKSNVNIRKEPKKDSQFLHTLLKGESIQYTCMLDNGWYEVLLGGHKAYVSGKYVDSGMKEMCTNTVNGVLAVTDEAYIYADKEFKQPMKKIPQPILCKIYNIGENYYLINSEYYGSGYLKKQDGKFLGDIAIGVDVTSQLCTLYVNGAYDMSIETVTGHSINSPTPLNLYNIDKKILDTTMSGHFVKYAMRLAIDKQEGHTNIFLHDADDWRNKYGGTIYIKKGSDGCININRQAAKELYDKVNVSKDPRLKTYKTKVFVYKAPYRRR